MSRQMHEIQYVRFYTDGSAARKTAAPRKQVAAAPAKQPTRSAKRPVVKIPVDPGAWAGMLVAGVMLIMMVVGVFQVNSARQEVAQLEGYVAQLQTKNEQLQAVYQEGYDLEEVEKLALALGMVPQNQVQTIHLQVPQPEVQVQPTLWSTFLAFVRGLLA